MIPTIIAAILDGTPQFTASKPSDVLGIVAFGSLFLLFTWVCLVIGKNFQAFMHGVAWVILLAFAALVLIVLFQVGYPGQ